MNAIRIQLSLDGHTWVSVAYYNLTQEDEALAMLARLKILNPDAQWRVQMPAYDPA